MGINIGDEISKMLREYTDDVIQATNESIEEAGKEAAKELKTAGDFKDRTGKYRRGWAVKPGEKRLGIQSQVVHNRKHYQLTNLLEYGHVNRDGSRTRAFPHIAPVEAKMGDLIERKLEEKL